MNRILTKPATSVLGLHAVEQILVLDDVQPSISSCQPTSLEAILGEMIFFPHTMQCIFMSFDLLPFHQKPEDVIPIAGQL